MCKAIKTLFKFNPMFWVLFCVKQQFLSNDIQIEQAYKQKHHNMQGEANEYQSSKTQSKCQPQNEKRTQPDIFRMVQEHNNFITPTKGNSSRRYA